MPSFAEVNEVKTRVEADILDRTGVTGVAVGYKYVAGRRTDELSIQVFVEQKKEVRSERQRIPSTIDGIKTDVIQLRFVPTPRSIPAVDFVPTLDTTRYSDLQGGMSIGRDGAVGSCIFAGTLGVLVNDNATGAPMILSNFHVMCVDNNWQPGDKIVQPSLLDGGRPSDVIAELQRAVLDSGMDAAVATITDRTTLCEILEIGAVAGSRPAIMNTAVRKRGRTTELTQGTIVSLDGTFNLTYDEPNCGITGVGTITFTNQIVIEANVSPAFGLGGDSGSVVVDAEGFVLGLYFAGNVEERDAAGNITTSEGLFGIASPIDPILTALDVQLWVESIKGKPELKEQLKEPVKETSKELLKEKEFGKDFIKEKELRKELIKEKDLKEPFKEGIKEEIKEDKDIFEGDIRKEIGDGKLFERGPGGLPIDDFANRLTRLEAVMRSFETTLRATQKRNIVRPATTRRQSSTTSWGATPPTPTLNKLEKEDFKENLKDNSKETKDSKDIKDFKDVAKDDFKEGFKENNKENDKENKDNKDSKDFKDVTKEGFKENNKENDKENKDNKDFKDVTKEGFKEEPKEVAFEKQVPDNKFFPDNGPFKGFAGENISNPGQWGFPSDIPSRMAQLEARVNQLLHFIGSDLRPDLSRGALRRETDVRSSNNDVQSVQQRLLKQANDAKQAKDMKDTEKLREG